MTPIKKNIIDIISKGSYTTKEMSILTKTPPSSIRGRISELRNEGYNIKTIPSKETVYRYVLVSYPIDNDKKIINYISQNNLYGKDVNFKELSKRLEISMDDVKDGYQKLFRNHTIIQTSNSSAKILQ